MSTVNIIMATYNISNINGKGTLFFDNQIESIIQQTYTDWSLYISDDESSDCSVEIIKNYCQKYPQKIFLLDTSRKGGSTCNFAYAFEHVPKAKYYMFSDQDDVWDNDKIEKLIKAMENQEKLYSSSNLVYCDARVVDSELRLKNESFFKSANLKCGEDNRKRILITNMAPGAVMLFDNDLKEKIKRISTKNMHDWYVMLCAEYLGHIHFVDETMQSYRQHDNNVAGAGIEVSAIGIFKYFRSGTFKKIKSEIKLHKDIQHKVCLQTQEFYDEHSHQLDKESSTIIDKFLKMNHTHLKLQKIFLIIKNKFYHNSLIQTLVYIMTI